MCYPPGGIIGQASNVYPYLNTIQYQNGQLWIGNGHTGAMQLGNLTAGDNITITNGEGSIVISATGGGGGDISGASNLGSSGQGVYDSVTAGVLGFRNIAPGSSKVTTTLDGSHNILVDVNPGAIDKNALAGGALTVANGGTGQTTFTNGQLLIGNSTGGTLSKATLAAGTGISVANGPGTITLSVNPSAIDKNSLGGSPLTVGNGGTGLNGIDNGQLLVGNSIGGFDALGLMPGSGISIMRDSSNIYISSSSWFFNANGALSTDDATPTTLLNIAYAPTGIFAAIYKVYVIGKRVSGTSGTDGDSATFERTFRLKAISGVLTVEDLQSDYTSKDQSSWDLQFNLLAPNSLAVQVVGAADNHIDWSGTMEYKFI